MERRDGFSALWGDKYVPNWIVDLMDPKLEKPKTNSWVLG